MSKHDVIIALFTIIYGLMLTDLFFSLHKLIRSRKNVKWHWLPLTTAWYLFVIILKNWWGLAFIQDISGWMNMVFFIAYGHLFVIIFLTVSTVLPDEISAEGVDLKEYYFKNHRYFWGLMSLFVFVSLGISILKKIYLGDPLILMSILANSAFIVLAGLLVISKRYWIHSTVMVVLLIQIVLEILNK